ncbi:hypothetical protein [Pseudalkalibacillus sp. SCS-8]|uniref:hypothetical protein n=1 Tax=Pseudalkalibacillus nanhaiensis TaxID=3115291 RepID=UPI0032DA9563
MKALPVESILQQIGRYHSKIELKPGQVFSGKVLTLYPNDMAQIQLAGQRMNAQLLTGLTRDKTYWFQVKRNPNGTVPLLSVVENGRRSDPPVQALGIKKMNADMRMLVDHLVRDQLPMTKELVRKAEQWLGQVSSKDKGMMAIKTMLLKNLPETNAVFQALYHVQDEAPLTSDLESLSRMLKNLQGTMGGTLPDVEGVIQRLSSRLESPPLLETLKQLVFLYHKAGTTENMKAQIKDIFRVLQLPMASKGEVQVLESLASNTERLSVLAEQLKLPLPPSKAESVIRGKLDGLNSQESNLVKTYIDGNVNKPQLPLMELIRGLGLRIERDLIQQNIADLERTPQLKPVLMDLLSKELPMNIREKVEALLHRLTGQQLLHTSENQTVNTFFYQLPIQFKEWKSDLVLKWDMKRTPTGEIDENHSRILFYLNLQHLNETVIDMNVQNRIITLKVINEHPTIEGLIPVFKDKLKGSLEALGYSLTSIKAEQPSTKHSQTFQSKMIENPFKGVDVTI